MKQEQLPPGSSELSLRGSDAPSPDIAMMLDYYRGRRDLIDRLIAVLKEWRASERQPEPYEEFDSYC